MTRPQVEAPKPNPPQRQPATLPQKDPANKPSSSNPYAVPRGNKCYRCGQTGHYSNQCRQNKPVNLTTHDDDVEEEVYPQDDEYEDEDEPEEFIHEDECKPREN